MNIRIDLFFEPEDNACMIYLKLSLLHFVLLFGDPEFALTDKGSLSREVAVCQAPSQSLLPRNLNSTSDSDDMPEHVGPPCGCSNDDNCGNLWPNVFCLRGCQKSFILPDAWGRCGDPWPGGDND